MDLSRSAPGSSLANEADVIFVIETLQSGVVVRWLRNRLFTICIDCCLIAIALRINRRRTLWSFGSVCLDKRKHHSILKRNIVGAFGLFQKTEHTRNSQTLHEFLCENQ